MAGIAKGEYSAKFRELLNFNAHPKSGVLLLKASVPVSAQDSSDFESALNYILQLHRKDHISPDQIQSMVAMAAEDLKRGNAPVPVI